MTRPAAILRLAAWLGCAVGCCLPNEAVAEVALSVLPGVVIRAAREPVVVGTTISIDGQPVTAVWDAYFTNLFAILDRNDDGLLDKVEAARIPRPACLLAEFRGDFDNVTAAFVPLADVDSSPADGNVSRDELAHCLRRAGIGLGELRVEKTAEGLDPAAAGKLFELLASPKGSWDSASLAEAPSRLRRLDGNDDERFSLAELRLLTAEKRPSRDIATTGRGLSGRAGSLPGNSPARQPLFGPLPDADADANAARVPHSITLTIQLDAAQPRVDQSTKHQPSNPNETYRIGAARLRLIAVGGNGGQDFDSARQSLLQQFEADDVDRNQMLDRREAQRSASSGYFAMLLAVADRNSDDRLILPEMNRYLDLQATAAKSCVVVTASDLGSSLLATLDANGDTNLSLRELKHGWSRVAGWDRNGDHELSWDEIPHDTQLTWSIGRPRSQASTAAGLSGQLAAPVWFQRMDRNADGDLSRREFLGTQEEFRQYDGDGDGLISPTEAGGATKN